VRFVDSNIFLRYLAAGDPAKSRACFDLFQRVQAGKEAVTTCEAVVTEVAYVLRSAAHYGLMPDEIGARLRPILSLRGLKLAQKGTYIRALDLWASYPAVDFEDVLSVAHMERQGLDEILSYDKDFDRIAGVRRFEP